MASTSSSVLRALIICSAILMAGCSAGRLPPKMGEIEVPLFVFGDSLFDPGNNNYLNGTIAGQATAWPYGETFFKRATGRLSDGRIVPDFTAEFFRLPIWKPYLEPGQRRFAGGANFASGGAGVLSQTHPGTISLREQLSYFKEVVKTLKQQFGDLQTKRLLTKAVYLFSMGGNDYFSFYSSYPSASQSSQKRFVATVLGNLTQVLEEIYSVGGRKIAFQNVGALGCVPINRAKTTDGSCLDGLSAMARQHNYGLSHSLANLERRLPGFKYSIFDYYHAILDRVNHPKNTVSQTGHYRAVAVQPGIVEEGPARSRYAVIRVNTCGSTAVTPPRLAIGSWPS